jgi:hypothetical protein
MVGHKTDKMMNHYTHNTPELLSKEYEKLQKDRGVKVEQCEIITPMCTPVCTESDKKRTKLPSKRSLKVSFDDFHEL